MYSTTCLSLYQLFHVCGSFHVLYSILNFVMSLVYIFKIMLANNIPFNMTIIIAQSNIDERGSLGHYYCYCKWLNTFCVDETPPCCLYIYTREVNQMWRRLSGTEQCNIQAVQCIRKHAFCLFFFLAYIGTKCVSSFHANFLVGYLNF